MLTGKINVKGYYFAVTVTQCRAVLPLRPFKAAKQYVFYHYALSLRIASFLHSILEKKKRKHIQKWLEQLGRICFGSESVSITLVGKKYHNLYAKCSKKKNSITGIIHLTEFICVS